MYFIYLNVAPYVADYCRHHFGIDGETAIEIPANTPEQKILRSFLDKQPNKVEVDKVHNLAIKIPCTKDKDPRVYNYVSPRVKEMLAKSLEKLIVWNMWTELSGFDKMAVNKTDLIVAWMERHGIEINDTNIEMMRKRYYRTRKAYAAAGVSLA